MKKLSFRPFLIPLLLIGTMLFLYVSLSYETTMYVTGENFPVLIQQNSGIAFQNTPRKYVLLKIITGNLNSSTNSLRIYEGGGLFNFLSNESLILQINYTVTNVKVWGDQGHEIRQIDSGSSITINEGNMVCIQWDIHIEPWLPILFIFGMIGIGATIGGAMYSTSRLKKHKYDKGLTAGIIWVSIGVCLVLAWLWG